MASRFAGDRYQHADGPGDRGQRRYSGNAGCERCKRLCLRGGWLGGLQVIDISTPTAPVIVGSVDTPGYAVGVSVANGYAYVAAGRSGLQVIDISTPTAPVIVGSVDTRVVREM